MNSENKGASIQEKILALLLILVIINFTRFFKNLLQIKDKTSNTQWILFKVCVLTDFVQNLAFMENASERDIWRMRVLNYHYI